MLGMGLWAALALAGTGVGTAPHTAEVQARGETVPVGTAAKDAADDPAIWRNAAHPRRSLIVATDKQAGLYVYGLDGRVRDFARDGRLNNVDLIELGRGRVLVAASDRNDKAHARIRLYWLDTQRAKLRPIGTVDGGTGEAYGLCLGRVGGQVQAYSVLKDGTVVQVGVTARRHAAQGTILRQMKLETQSEGCVVDHRTQTLFVGEEDRGIWAFDARPNGATQGKLVAAVDGGQLVADVEGLAILPKGKKGGWLIASSQGDNAYALYTLPDVKPAGRFRIAAGRFGATSDTDGIAAARGNFGRRYKGGLFVAQDGDNAPHAQNFKLVSWRDIRRQIKP
jgi:3-phytase